MKKRNFTMFILTVVCILTTCFALTACNGNVDFKINFIVDKTVYKTISTSGGETIKMPENPVKDDYNFDGWFWDKDVWEKPFTANSLLDAPLSSDMNVYAKFTKKHEHSYSATITAPTCTEKGFTTYTCECGDSYTDDYVDELGHDYNAVVTEPTCTEQGYTTHTCSRCKDSYVDTYINATGHDFGAWTLTKEPTCTEIGIETRYCLNDNTHTETRTINALDHDYNAVATLPTCTEQGYTTHTCSRCKDSYLDTYTNATGHKFTNYVSNNDADYEKDGTKTAHCDHGCGATDTVVDEGTALTSGIIFKTLTVNGNEVYGKVPNNRATYYFLDEITVNGNASYTLSYDISGNEKIPSKTVSLSIGDNTYYIVQFIGDEPQNIFKVTVRRKPIYTLTFNTNSGTAVSERYVEEDDLTDEPTVTMPGYTFVGWDYDFSTPIKSSLTINASWSANTDTPYQVEYYLQNLNNDNYTIADIDNLQGTTDTTATAEIKAYEHFTPTANAVKGNINGDESTVLKVYYTRDSYSYTTVNENTKGGAISCTADGNYRYETVIYLNATVNAGYDFIGWYKDNTFVSDNAEYSFKLSEDSSIVAKWSANTNTPYKVEYYQQNLANDSYTLKETVNLTGTTDTTATAEIKSYSNFTPLTDEVKGNINGDGSTVLKVYYTRDKYAYTVINDNVKGGSINCTQNGTYKYDTEIVLKVAVNDGYDFGGWYKDNKLLSSNLEYTFNLAEKTDITAKYIAHTNTPYKVEYYLQNLANDNYTLNDYEFLQGTTDTTAIAEIKVYEHFTHRIISESIESGNINGNGSTVLKVYYSRNRYSVILNKENEKGTISGAGVYANAQNVTVKATVNAGYTFIGWFENSNIISVNAEYSFNPIRDISLTAKWSANTNTPYKVEYYQQNLNNDSYTIVDNINLTGTTDTIASAEIKTYEHFTPMADEVKGNIDGNGLTVLKVYYTRDKYLYSAVNENTKGGSISCTTNGIHKYETPIYLNASVNAGYDFIGWYKDNTLISNNNKYSFKLSEDSQITAKWYAHTNIVYSVEYYQQNLVNSSYTLKETLYRTGTTDTTVYAEIKTYEHFTPTANEVKGNLNGDGSTVLKVYYTRDKYTYTVTNENTKGGTVSCTASGTYKYDTTITLSATVNAGYDFSGWYKGSTLISSNNNYSFNLSETSNITAKYYAHTDTAYVVEYYHQNLVDSNYSLKETNDMQGTTDTVAYANIKAFEHFTPTKTEVKGNINGDGSTVLKVYYTRDEYIYSATIENSKGGSILCTKNGTYKYDSTINLSATVNDGYDFIGWFNNGNYISSELEYTLNLSENSNIVAKYFAHTNTLYKVEYYQQNLENDDYTLIDSEFLTGITDTMAIAEIGTYEHFTPISNEVKGNINGDGSTVLKVYYTRNRYIITLSKENDKGSVSGAGAFAYVETVTVKAIVNIGYTFIGWFDNDNKVSDETEYSFNPTHNISLTAKWIANTDTAYTVNHYQQNILDDDYTLIETQNLTGTSDSSITPATMAYEGFTSPSAQTTTVLSDGSRVVDYYYTRNYYTITVVGNGGSNNSIRQKYQSTIDAVGWTTRDGYTLGGLYNNVALTSVYSDTIMPAEDKTVYAYWEGENFTYEFDYNYSSTSATIVGYKGSSTIVNIPTQIGGRPVTTISSTAFTDKTTLVSIVVPNSVTSIGAGAFKGCNSLTSISIPFVGTSRTAKYYNAVFGIIFGSSTKKSLNTEYSGYIPDSYSFVDTKYSSVEGATWQYSYVSGQYEYTNASGYHSGHGICSWFYYIPSTLTTVTITDATVIPEEAFYNCANITVVNINNGVTTIGQNAFRNMSNLATIVIPNSVTEIQTNAFNGCSKLTSVTIPNSVTSIGKDAFKKCSVLNSIVFEGTTVQWNAIQGYSAVPSPCTIYCTNGKVIYS